MRVFVYRNLRAGKLSVMDLRTRRVILRADYVVLKGCTFRVSQAGRARVLREKCKNVHAGVVGELVDAWDDGDEGKTLPSVEHKTRVTYNPYLFSTFVQAETNEAVASSLEALVTVSGVFI